MTATTCSPPFKVRSTSVFTAPLIPFLTVPASMLRALIFIVHSPAFDHNTKFPRSLALEIIFRKKNYVGGALRKTAHEIGIPLRTERNIAAHAPAFPGQALLQIA